MNMNLKDMLISALMKKGVLYEARNCDMEIDVPFPQVNANGEAEEKTVKIRFKAEHVKISLEKE